jgi:hypothetical protein
MDDNELQNEQEKREHELELAKLNRPPISGWVKFWEVVGDNAFLVFMIVLVIVGAIVTVKTGQKFPW